MNGQQARAEVIRLREENRKLRDANKSLRTQLAEAREASDRRAVRAFVQGADYAYQVCLLQKGFGFDLCYAEQAERLIASGQLGKEA